MRISTFLLVLIGASLLVGCPGKSDDDAPGDDDATGDDDDNSTCEVSEPVTDPQSDLVGSDYFLDLGSAHLTEPSAAETILAQYLADVYLMVGIHIETVSDADGTVDAFAAQLEGNGQNMCVPTIPLTDQSPGEWNNPCLFLGPGEFPFDVNGATETTSEFAFEGWASPDGAEIHGALLDGVLDTRVLDELFDPGADEGAGCELLAHEGVACSACPDGGESFCVDYVAEQIMGDRVEQTATNPETGEVYDSLVEVTQAQVDAWTAAGYCP